MRHFLKPFLLCLLLSAAAHAESYRMDLIVFLDKDAADEFGRAAYVPDLSKALELDNEAALKAAGIVILPDDQFALTEQWQRLRNSRRYQPLIRLAWTQKDPPDERTLALHLKWGERHPVSNGDGMGVSMVAPVDGSVALVLGHYLHLDADLAYTQKAAGGGGYVSYRLKEKRRMKRDELHHLDSPKLGILARVTKAKSP